MAIQHFCSGTGTKEAGTRADCDYCGQFYGTESHQPVGVPYTLRGKRGVFMQLDDGVRIHAEPVERVPNLPTEDEAEMTRQAMECGVDWHAYAKTEAAKNGLTLPEQTQDADGKPLHTDKNWRVTHVSINYPSALYPDGWTRATLEYKRRIRENKPHLRLRAILGAYSKQPLWWITQEDRETPQPSRYVRSEQAISMATSRWHIHGHV